LRQHIEKFDFLNKVWEVRIKIFIGRSECAKDFEIDFFFERSQG
jgi:hypothetical protein